MKLYQLNEMSCPVCGLNTCQCNTEQEEVEYNGKKITVGKHDDLTDRHFDHHELQMGIEDEMEHTNDERIAKAIAKDHLSEIPDFYSRMRRMKNRNKTFKEWVEHNG